MSGNEGRLIKARRSLSLIIYIDFNNVFDPDQDPEEKRAVRQNYRSLAKTIEGNIII